ncbi:hypothetical protein F5Y10DRAFT_192022 [Nemania abortiva]|nr:hypothetical protein F5Y10DRAFT_192022 [Nemania abortiva]
MSIYSSVHFETPSKRRGAVQSRPPGSWTRGETKSLGGSSLYSTISPYSEPSTLVKKPKTVSPCMLTLRKSDIPTEERSVYRGKGKKKRKRKEEKYNDDVALKQERRSVCTLPLMVASCAIQKEVVTLRRTDRQTGRQAALHQGQIQGYSLLASSFSGLSFCRTRAAGRQVGRHLLSEGRLTYLAQPAPSPCRTYSEYLAPI